MRSSRQAKDQAKQRMTQQATAIEKSLPLSDNPNKKKNVDGILKPTEAVPQANEPATEAATSKPKRVSKTPESVNANLNLFTSFKAGGVAPQTIIDDWLVRYKREPMPSLLEIFQFFIDCCTGTANAPSLPADLIEKGQSYYPEAIQRLTMSLEGDITWHYPLSQVGLVGKRVHAVLCDFIHNFVQCAQYNIIYDERCFEDLIHFLITLSDSQVRALRHTATLASMRFMRHLVGVAQPVNTQYEQAKIQCASEQKKSKSLQSVERLESLQQRIEFLEIRRAVIHQHLLAIFRGVFMHRYRDTLPAIRVICVEELGACILNYPSRMVDDTYLKYLGRMLHDKTHEVRYQCVRVLHSLYSSETIEPSSLQLFTVRFKGRLLDMALDRDMDVAVVSMQLLIVLWRYDSVIFDGTDMETVYELLFCTHRPLAIAAGKFISLKLFQPRENENPGRSGRGKMRSMYSPRMRDLVLFFQESEMYDHAAYLVDSLWESCDMLRDWECMLDLLLEEPGPGESPLSQDEEARLLEIFVCCVRQAVTGECPAGRWSTATASSGIPDIEDETPTVIPRHPPPCRTLTGNTHAVFEAYTGHGLSAPKPVSGAHALTNHEQRALHEEKERVTQHLMVCLPTLLTRFGASRDHVEKLLELPLYMDLHLYTLARQERLLDLLLKCLQECVARHSDPNVLSAISMVYATMCEDSQTICDKCIAARDSLVDLAVENLREVCSIVCPVDESHDGRQIDSIENDHSLMCALRRISAFYSNHDLTSWDLWPHLTRVCALARHSLNDVDETNQGMFGGRDLDDKCGSLSLLKLECISAALECCQHVLVWGLRRCMNAEDVTKEIVRHVSGMLEHFIGLCNVYLKDRSDVLAQDAFLALGDLFILFSPHHISQRENVVLQPLSYSPTEEMMSLLSNYIEHRILQWNMKEAEGELPNNQEIYTRRVLLSSYCKLIIHKVLPMQSAVVVLKYSTSATNLHFIDVLKCTLVKLRDMSRDDTLRLILSCLQSLFEDIQLSHQPSPTQTRSTEFKSLLELAHILNQMYGLDAKRASHNFLMLHEEGIKYCKKSPLQPSSMSSDKSALGISEETSMSSITFLEVLVEFTGKLNKPERQNLLEHLKQVFPNSSKNASLKAYKAALEEDNHPTTAPHVVDAKRKVDQEPFVYTPPVPKIANVSSDSTKDGKLAPEQPKKDQKKRTRKNEEKKVESKKPAAQVSALPGKQRPTRNRQTKDMEEAVDIDIDESEEESEAPNEKQDVWRGRRSLHNQGDSSSAQKPSSKGEDYTNGKNKNSVSIEISKSFPSRRKRQLNDSEEDFMDIDETEDEIHNQNQEAFQSRRTQLNNDEDSNMQKSVSNKENESKKKAMEMDVDSENETDSGGKKQVASRPRRSLRNNASNSTKETRALKTDKSDDTESETHDSLESAPEHPARHKKRTKAMEVDLDLSASDTPSTNEGQISLPFRRSMRNKDTKATPSNRKTPPKEESDDDLSDADHIDTPNKQVIKSSDPPNKGDNTENSSLSTGDSRRSTRLTQLKEINVSGQLSTPSHVSQSPRMNTRGSASIVSSPIVVAKMVSPLQSGTPQKTRPRRSVK